MSEDKKDNDKYQPKSEPNTLQDQAWKRARENKRPHFRNFRIIDL